jgi:hypothetical protein
VASVRRKRPGLFWEDCRESGWLPNGTWTAEPVERRLTQKELAECYELWRNHSDIREGRVKAA